MKLALEIQKQNFVLSEGEKEMARMFTTLQEMDDFENAVRVIIRRQQTKLNLSDETVGKIAFSFMPGQRTKVQALLVGQGAGKYRKPQRMRTPDLMNLCEALGLKWQEVIREAEKTVKQAQKEGPS
jgi:hypothetical protein